MTDRKDRKDRIIDELFALYQQYGRADYIGEAVSQLDHALQCAAIALWDRERLGMPSHESNCLVTAALLHDVGQLKGVLDANTELIKRALEDGHPAESLGVAEHEHLGADYLEALGFQKTVGDLIRLHVSAKRYLARSPDYCCSSASRGTLIQQGGPMNDLEAAKFEHHPLFREAILLRSYDDGGKVEGLEPSHPLESYRMVLRDVLRDVVM